jgi:hypothetical protein
MSNAVVIKQGTPSAPGTVVDTDAAKVVPPSPEVKTEAASREVAGQRKATQAKIGALAKGMTGGKNPAAAKKAKPAKPRGTGNGSGPAVRLTATWMSAKKKDVAVKDEVTTSGGVVIRVIGRWTRRAKDESLTPMVTGRIVSGAPDGKKKGDRHNSPASDCTHVAKK